MPIFREENGKLKMLKLNPFPYERNLQQLIEQNLLEVLDLHFLATEYPTTFGGRIDTLAVDTNGAPVIIEYKLSKNENVINQALSYLRWLKAQKIEFFEMLVQKKLGEQIAKKLNIDWLNPRVICIAESYSKFDIDTVEVIPMRMELFQYRYYEGGILSLELVNVQESKVKEIKKSVNHITEIRTNYDGNITTSSQAIKELYTELRSLILGIDENIEEKSTKSYIAFRLSKNFAEVHVQRAIIKIYLRPINYEDPKGLMKKIPDTHLWTLDREVCLSRNEELEYVLPLIEQSYKDVL